MENHLEEVEEIVNNFEPAMQNSSTFSSSLRQPISEFELSSINDLRTVVPNLDLVDDGYIIRWADFYSILRMQCADGSW